MANVEREQQTFEDRSNKTEQTQINEKCILKVDLEGSTKIIEN